MINTICLKHCHQILTQRTGKPQTDWSLSCEITTARGAHSAKPKVFPHLYDINIWQQKEK